MNSWLDGPYGVLYEFVRFPISDRLYSHLRALQEPMAVRVRFHGMVPYILPVFPTTFSRHYPCSSEYHSWLLRCALSHNRISE
jgi:hypothetical protein